MIRTDSELFAKINQKFSGIEKGFPTSELETFLAAINSTIQFYQANVFKQLKDDEDVGYCNLPELIGFSNLEQELFANSVLGEVMSHLGNGFFGDLTDEHKNDKIIEFYLGDFFRQSKRQKEKILLKIKVRKEHEIFKNEFGIHILKDDLSFYESLEEKLKVTNSYILELEMNSEALTFLKSDLLEAKNILSSLLLGVSSSRVNSFSISSVSEAYKNSSHIFKGNSYILFDLLMTKYTIRGRGKEADISFFYRRMVYDDLIAGSIEDFRFWVVENYEWVKSIDKVKTLVEVKNPTREHLYSIAKDSIGFKSQV